MKPTPAWVVAASAAATMALASSTEGASGFSQSTCLPAPSRASTTSRCIELATATLDDVDVGRVDDGLPRRLGALVAEPLRRVDRERLVGVSDRDESGVRAVGDVEQAAGGAVAGRVRAADHADADDGDAE